MLGRQLLASPPKRHSLARTRVGGAGGRGTRGGVGGSGGSVLPAQGPPINTGREEMELMDLVQARDLTTLAALHDCVLRVGCHIRGQRQKRRWRSDAARRSSRRPRAADSGAWSSCRAGSPPPRPSRRPRRLARSAWRRGKTAARVAPRSRPARSAPAAPSRRGPSTPRRRCRAVRT